VIQSRPLGDVNRASSLWPAAVVNPRLEREE